MSEAKDEVNLTDIELLPDGRIFIFGASAEVLEILNKLQVARDPELSGRLQRLCECFSLGEQVAISTQETRGTKIE